MLEHEQTIASLQRQQQIDQALREAGAIDQDAAQALIDSALKQVPQPDVAQAVKDLCRSKPYLFRQRMRRGKPASGVMSARASAADSPRATDLDRAADAALQTGKRIDVLRYLRLRRAK